MATGWSDQLSGRELHTLKIRALSTAHCHRNPYSRAEYTWLNQMVSEVIHQGAASD
jgi:hypothetical protein